MIYSPIGNIFSLTIPTVGEYIDQEELSFPAISWSNHLGNSLAWSTKDMHVL